MGVIVKEAEEFILELWELLLAGESRIVFHIVVHQVDALGLKKLAQFGVLMDDVSQMDFVDFGVKGLVSDSGPKQHPRQNGEPLEADSEIPELVKEQRNRGQYEDLEGVLIPLAAIVDGFKSGEDSIE